MPKLTISERLLGTPSSLGSSSVSNLKFNKNNFDNFPFFHNNYANDQSRPSPYSIQQFQGKSLLISKQ